MTELNTDPTYADIVTLAKLQIELSRVKAAEAMLRRRIADHFFPKPVEGSKENKYPLNDGTGAILQMEHKINRKVLEAELDAYKTASKEEGANLPDLPWNKLIKYTPELVTAEYRKLTKEERAACDLVLEIKPGMPSLEVVIPKRT
jgi:hypothetical protein